MSVRTMMTGMAAGVVAVGLLTAAPAVAADGAIDGTVLGTTGTPVRGALVEAFDADVPFGDQDSPASVTTDSQGHYRLPVAPGRYVIRTSATSFGSEFWNDQPTFASADRITVGDGSTETADVELAPGRTVSGTVTDGAGRGLRLVQVVALALDDEGTSDAAASTVTGSDGAFAIALQPGRYRLYYFGASVGYLSEYWDDQTSASAAEVIVVDGADLPDHDARLSRGGSLSGRVTSDAATAVDGLDATLYDAEGRSVETDTVDGAGRYEFDALPAGRYRVGFDHGAAVPEFWDDEATLDAATPIEVGVDDVVTGIDADVEPFATNTARPSISSTTPRVGEPLTATPGTWTRTEGITWIYQWYMDGVAINAGKQAEYTPTAGTLGKRLTVSVRGVRKGASIGSATSSSTERTAQGRIGVVRAPTLKGRAVVGSTLEADRGYWTPSGLTWSYVWVRDGKAIPTSVPGSRSARYTLTAADWGKKVAVRVSGERSGYGVQRRYTPAVPVLRAPSMSNTTSVLGGGRVKLTAKVVVVGTSSPAGSVAVLEDGEQVGTIASLSKGVGSIVLTGRSPGSHTYTLEYSGNRLVEPASRSRTVVVR